jgi:DNA repair protein RadD
MTKPSTIILAIMTPLRPFQRDLEARIYNAWLSGARNVMPVLPTGGGKTVLFGSIIAKHNGPSTAIAHRQELTAQISLALARNGVRHRVIGGKTLHREIVQIHMAELGRDYTNQYAPAAVAGVDTLLNLPPSDPIFQSTLVTMDEGHHVLAENKWGKALTMFPNARGLFPTATPKRADRKGLGRHADGLADALVLGPTMRELINMGYLTDYRIFAPPCDVDISHVPISDSTGDYNQVQLRNIIHESKSIVGDVVSHYLKIAPGKLGVTFAVDVEEATKISRAFNTSGVKAEVVSAKTPASARAAILRRFKNREILQLVNVDLFGEGFDLPAIEVVSMARPTMSYSLFCQQFGRALRLMIPSALAGAWDTFTDEQRRAHIYASSKPTAIIIDHVSNVVTHGLPDAYREWSLDRGERRSKGRPTDVVPCRTCLNVTCLAVYERVYKACPFCGNVPTPADRSAPDVVDGDLQELDPSVLAALRGEIERIEGSPYIPQHLRNSPASAAIVNNHRARQDAQKELKDNIALWAGYQKYLGRDDSETYRRFFFMFGTDIMTAQTLNAADARALSTTIASKLIMDGVVKI